MKGTRAPGYPSWFASLRSLGTSELVRTTGILALPLLLWWVALLPGGMSPDSFVSWGQVQGGPWSNHHPAPFTALMWLTSLGGLTPATVSLFQVLLVAGCLASLVVTLRRVFAVGHAVTAAAVALILLPLLGPFATILWKDVPETALLLLLAALVLELPDDRSVSRRRLLAIAGVAFAIALLRWNGGLTDVVIGTGLLASRAWRLRLPVAAAFGAAGIAGFLVLSVIPDVFPVAPVNAVESSQQQLTELAQYVHGSSHALRPAERQVLERVAPLKEWSSAGSLGCYSVNPTIYDMIQNKGRDAIAEANISDLKAVWIHVSLRHPVALLRAHLCRSGLAWRLFLGPHALGILTVYPMVDKNSFGLHPQAPEWLRAHAVRYAKESNKKWLMNIAWLPAPWLLAAVLVGVAAHRRTSGRRTLTLTFLVPAAVLLSYAAFPAAEDARYTYAAVVVCQLSFVAYAAGFLSSRAGTGFRR